MESVQAHPWAYSTNIPISCTSRKKSFIKLSRIFSTRSINTDQIRLTSSFYFLGLSRHRSSLIVSSSSDQRNNIPKQGIHSNNNRNAIPTPPLSSSQRSQTPRREKSPPSRSNPNSNPSNNFVWQQGIPILPRISAEDERNAAVEGHFVQRLVEAGLLDESGEITSLGHSDVASMSASLIHLIINKMLSMNKRYQTVLAVVRDLGYLMGPVNLATAMHRLGRLVRSARKGNPSLPDRLVYNPQYQFMLRRAEDLVDAMAPRTVANFLWGMAAVRDQKNTGIILRIGQRLMEIDPSALKTQELSNVVWSLATLEVHLPELMNRMLDSACDRIDDCVPQALSNMIWACATLHYDHPRFTAAVAASAAPRLRTFQSQTLANTLWAYSVLGIYPPDLFVNAADEIVWRLEERKNIQLESMRNGGAVMNQQNRQYHQRQDTSAQYIHSPATNNGTNIRRKSRVENGYESGNSSSGDEAEPSFSSSSSSSSPSSSYSGYNSSEQDPNLPPPRQSGATMDRQSYVLDDRYDFRGQEISNVLIAYARGRIIHPVLLDTLEKDLCSSVTVLHNGEEVQIPRLEEFTSQALANTLWAYATLRWYPARLLPSITSALGHIIPSMTAQEMSNSLWAYARFAYHPGRVLGSFLAVIERRLDEFEGQGCTNSLWALAVLKATHSTAFVGLLRRYVVLEQQVGSFGEVQYNQVLQAALLAQFEARGGRVAWRPEVDLPEQVVDRALNAWASQQTSTQLSGFHLDVSEGLIRLGIGHHIEYLVARDLLSIDIAVTKEGRQIAIEVDGPFHFPVNAKTPLGHTMIRRRLLRAAGWIVVSIPWYEWFAKETWEERLSYLAAVLSKADESLVQQLRPAAVGEMLSTEFLPGPGEEDVALEDVAMAAAGATRESDLNKSSIANAALFAKGDDDAQTQQPTLQYENEDGPVLASQYTPPFVATLGGGTAPILRSTGSLSDTADSQAFTDTSTADAVHTEVNTGLMEVLGRPNVLLTPGAIRRLQSMGLDDVVRQIEERRRAYNKKGKNALTAAAATSGIDYAYAPPPSMRGDTSTSGSGSGSGMSGVAGASGLLPKPPRAQPRAHRHNGHNNNSNNNNGDNSMYGGNNFRIGTRRVPPSPLHSKSNRFNPRFASNHKWGHYFKTEKELAEDSKKLLDNDAQDYDINTDLGSAGDREQRAGSIDDETSSSIRENSGARDSSLRNSSSRYDGTNIGNKRRKISSSSSSPSLPTKDIRRQARPGATEAVFSRVLHGRMPGKERRNDDKSIVDDTKSVGEEVEIDRDENIL